MCWNSSELTNGTSTFVVAKYMIGASCKFYISSSKVTLVRSKHPMIVSFNSDGTRHFAVADTSVRSPQLFLFYSTIHETYRVEVSQNISFHFENNITERPFVENKWVTHTECRIYSFTLLRWTSLSRVFSINADRFRLPENQFKSFLPRLAGTPVSRTKSLRPRCPPLTRDNCIKFHSIGSRHHRCESMCTAELSTKLKMTDRHQRTSTIDYLWMNHEVYAPLAKTYSEQIKIGTHHILSLN